MVNETSIMLYRLVFSHFEDFAGCQKLSPFLLPSDLLQYNCFISLILKEDPFEKQLDHLHTLIFFAVDKAFINALLKYITCLMAHCIK